MGRGRIVPVANDSPQEAALHAALPHPPPREIVRSWVLRQGVTGISVSCAYPKTP